MAIIAVAGGTGKLGRAIVEALVEQGQHSVVALAREVIISQYKAWQEDI